MALRGCEKRRPERQSFPPPLVAAVGAGVESGGVVYHPVTIARDTLREADAVFEALERLTQQTLFCFPNSDAGSRGLIERAGEFCSSRAS